MDLKLFPLPVLNFQINHLTVFNHPQQFADLPQPKRFVMNQELNNRFIAKVEIQGYDTFKEAISNFDSETVEHFTSNLFKRLEMVFENIFESNLSLSWLQCGNDFVIFSENIIHIGMRFRDR